MAIRVGVRIIGVRFGLGVSVTLGWVTSGEGVGEEQLSCNPCALCRGRRGADQRVKRDVYLLKC